MHNNIQGRTETYPHKHAHTGNKVSENHLKKERLPTFFLRWHENAVQFFGRGTRTHSPSLQESLQGSALPGLVPTGQAGAAAPRVHSTRLSLSEGARHAAAAAGLLHPLHTVFRQRLALQERAGVARLTSNHGAHSAGEPGECSQRGNQTKHTDIGHSTD